MIFVTVGYQMPFDRLIEAVDGWKATRPDAEAFAQIGPTPYRPRALESVAFMDPAEFARRIEAAKIVVAHAGMGSILTALEHGKPILVMPRRAKWQETRNDHQVATARRLREVPGIHVAMDESELPEALDRLASTEHVAPISPHASPTLVDRVRGFIAGG